MVASLAALTNRAALMRRQLHELRQADPAILTARSAIELAARTGTALDPWQARALSTGARNIMLLASRQAGKSTVADVAGLQQAVDVPGSLTLIVSPTERQSKRLLKSIRKRYAHVRSESPAVTEGMLSLELRNGSEIHALPGSEETIRGFSSVDLLILDEGARVPDSLYASVRPMLAISNGRLLALSTPFGRRGWFYDEWTNGEGWHRELVKATDSPRISAEFLEQERRSLPEIWFRQEYMCEFVETVDQIFGYDLLDAALSDDVEPLFGVQEDPWNVLSDLAPLP